MDLNLTDRVFVVTAASSGLGYATARSWWPKVHAWSWSPDVKRFWWSAPASSARTEPSRSWAISPNP